MVEARSRNTFGPIARERAGATLLFATLMACGGAAKTTKVDVPKPTASVAVADGPRIAPELAPIVAWIPNESGTLMLLTPRSQGVSIDTLIEPLLMEMPDAISSMIAGVGSIRSGFEIVAGPFDGPVFVRAQPGAGYAKREAIGRLREGAKTVGPEDTISSNGFRATSATRLNVASWSTVTIDQNLVTLVPFEDVDDYTKLLAVHAVGDPRALKGQRVTNDPELIAMVWYAPSPYDHDARPLTFATIRLSAVAGTEASLTLTMMLEPEKNEDAKEIASGLESVKRAVPERVAASYRAAKVSTENASGKTRVTFDITF